MTKKAPTTRRIDVAGNLDTATGLRFFAFRIDVAGDAGIGSDLIDSITVSEASGSSLDSGPGSLIDIDEMSQATDQLQLPDTVPELALALDNGISLVVDIAFSLPNQTPEMVCVKTFINDTSTGGTCGEPTEISGLLTFGIFDGKVAVLSNLDQPIEFEASTCREQWSAEAAPFRLQVCDSESQYATLNGIDADGNPAHTELWGG